MKPWQTMTLLAIVLAIITHFVCSLLPDDRFAIGVGMASALTIIGVFVMRPAQKEE